MSLLGLLAKAAIAAAVAGPAGVGVVVVKEWAQGMLRSDGDDEAATALGAGLSIIGSGDGMAEILDVDPSENS